MTHKDEITWLHLSDVHSDLGSGWDQRPVLNSLINDLRQQHRDHDLRPDLIFVTGDLAYGETSESTMDQQYDYIAGFLDQVRSSFGSPNIPKDDIYIVPGNHDVNIKRITKGTMLYLNELRKSESDDEIVTIQKNFSPDYKAVAERLDDYNKFLQRAGYEHLTLGVYKERSIYAARREIKGINIGIAGFNSAWSCAGQPGEQGKILLGRWQYEVLHQEVEGCQLRIALIHHPLDWLSETEKNRIRSLFARSFQFTLHGHEHDPDVRQDLDSKNVTVSASAVYQGSKRSNGYNFVCYPIDSGAIPTVVMRRYTEAGGRGWVPFSRTDFPDGHYKVKGLPSLKRASANIVSLRTGSDLSNVSLQTTSATRVLDGKLPAEFEDVLRPRLDELRKLMFARKVAMVFLGPRLGHMIPDIPEEFRDSAKVREFLNRQPLRDSSVDRALLLDVDGSLRLIRESDMRSDDTGWTTKLTRHIVSEHKDLTKRTRLTTQSTIELLDSWRPNATGPILYPIKYIPSEDNRDVVGFLSSDTSQSLNGEEAANIRKYVELNCLPILRSMCMGHVRATLASAKTRSQILSTVLEAALGISGSDWGCIKTSCLGAKRTQQFSADDLETAELVRAECVFNCPRFFHEGRLISTEGLVDRAIRKDANLLLPIGKETKDAMSHPAAQIFVALIRDSSGVSEPPIEGTDVVGALVVQHTSQNYLSDHLPVYAPLLDELCSYVAPAIRSIAAESMAKIIGQPKTSITEFVRTRALNLVTETFFESDGWILLEPSGSRFEIVAQSENVKPDLKSLLGLSPSIDYRRSILGVARDNKVTLFTPDTFDSSSRHVLVKRVNGEDEGTRAYFNDDFHQAVHRLNEQKRERLILDIGDRKILSQSEQNRGGASGIAIIVGPIIFPTGLPVGLLAVARSQAIRHDQAKAFQDRLQGLAEPLWARTKRISN